MSPATPKTTVHRPAIRTTVSSPELETPLGSSGPKAPGHTLELNTAISARALSVRDLSVDFTTAQGPLRAIDRVSFDLAPGEVLALVGESGSGKSVTARALLGLTDPVTQSVGGAVLLEGESLLPLSQAAWRSRRGRRIALILQDPMTCLDPLQTVGAHMLEALRAHRSIGQREAHDIAVQALERMGIGDAPQRLRAWPHQLSGGLRQRVSIAMALLHRPAVIVADEPTTALDVTVQGQILSQVQALARDSGTAFLWITHDLAIVERFADRVAVMYAGQIVETGQTARVFSAPRHPYTRALLDCVPQRYQPGERLAVISGLAPSLAGMPGGCRFRARCAQAQVDCSHWAPATRTDSDGSYLCLHPLTP